MKQQITERRGRIRDLDRSFDLEFWQTQTPQARFDALWELIVHAHRARGKDVRQLRLDRSIEKYGKQQRLVLNKTNFSSEYFRPAFLLSIWSDLLSALLFYPP